MAGSFSRPTLPYVVVDQNALRDQRRIEALLARAKAFGELVLLPDIALYEMMQSDQLESTVRASLKPLSSFPAAVVLARAPGELLRQELESGDPCFDIVDHEATLFLRRLLADVPTGASNVFDELRARVPAARGAFQQQQVDHVENKQRILRMADAWRTLLGRDLLRAVNHQVDENREGFRLLLANPRFHDEVIRSSLLREGFSEAVASGPSVAAWQFFCFAGLALKWVVRGWNSRTEANASHDLADLDYVLLALFCRGGLASKDEMQVELYDDLCAALDRFEATRSTARGSGERRRDLKARARELAQDLAKTYGVRRVVLFGSLAHEDERIPADIDLYVEGLPLDRWADACSRADAMMGDIGVDLVIAETAHSFVKETVATEGETLYEAPLG